MDFAIAKISTKGQIVIPSQLRDDIESGDEFLIVKDEDRIILKKVKKMVEEFKDDLKFAKVVAESWEKYESGKFKTKSKKDFLKELKKC
jgi:AbrB family looped-hinge helix DNA binding protein